MSVQPFLIGSGWIEARDGDASALTMFRRHYSFKPRADGRRKKLIAGPGEKLVLLRADARALFVWRRSIRDDGQVGVNCAAFRNEGAGVASELILEAETFAWARWPGERLFTFVNPRKVRGNPPGNCFIRAGWRRCGTTQERGLHIFEKLPDWARGEG